MIPAAVHIHQNTFIFLLDTQKTRHIQYLFSVPQKKFPIFSGAGNTILIILIALMIAFQKQILTIFILFVSCAFPDPLKEFCWSLA